MSNKAEKPSMKGFWIFLLITGFLFIVAVSSDPDNSGSSNSTATSSRESRIKDQFSSWDGSHRKVEAYVKARMHNPKSYSHIQTHYIDNEDHLIILKDFRGANAFGGIIRNSIRAKVDMNGNIIEASW